MKKIKLEKIFKTYSDNFVRINFTLTKESENNAITLWYELEKEYDSFICAERCDCVVVSLFLTAMKSGYEVIESNYPISEKLYYNLTYHVIPQFYNLNKKKYAPIKIVAPLTKEAYSAEFTAAGMSRGVDSFATLYEYGGACELEDYNIDYLTYFNVGAHHGTDIIVGKSKHTKRELFDGQLEKTQEFCSKYNRKLIVVDSNLSQVLATQKFFLRDKFDRTNTVRNIGIGFLLQKKIKRYYYSSAYNLNLFDLSLNVDSGKYEKWLLGYLRTENIEFYNSNQNWSRMEKLKKICDLEESYDYLQVCFVGVTNCGVCAKCKKTLMELDALGGGILDKYKNSFNIERYKHEHRRLWFDSIWELKEPDNLYGNDYKEIFTEALSNNPDLIHEPITNSKCEDEMIECSVGTLNIRRLPDANSLIIGHCYRGDRYRLIGSYKDWNKIELPGGQNGFVFSNYTKIVNENKRGI